MMTHSIWSSTTDLPTFPLLRGKRKTDVLIIGGGIAGVLCAHMLQRAGVDYILAEAQQICGGITKNTTAKITAQHGLIYHRLLHRFGIEKARMYLEANLSALRQYEKLCRTVDCSFERQDSFIYTIDQKHKLEKELSALEKLGFPAEYVSHLPLPFSVAGAIKFRDQAQFHPLRFVKGIAPNLHIFEYTPVRELVGLSAITDRGKISAKKIIVTTHFPLLNKHGSYFLKLYQHRSYATALKEAPNVAGMYADAEESGLSFRNHEDLLLLGGGGHRTGKKGGAWKELAEFSQKHYPQAKEVSHWATQDCISLDGVPYIGQYAKTTPDLYVATGFNKWGMTSAMTAAMILSDLVQEKENPYTPVFSPSRTILRPQLFINSWESAVNLLTPTTPRCPHMGCALKWNRQEHSWDCPCHGSRFDGEGKLIDNPSAGDLKKTER